MKRFLIYLLLFYAPLLVAQETVLSHEMGDEAARDKINDNFTSSFDKGDSLALEIDTVNARVDSSKAVFNYEDSTVIIITLEVDTAELSYIKIDPAMGKILFFSLSKMKQGVGNPPGDGVEQGFVVWGVEFTSIDSDGIVDFSSTTTALDSVQITAGTPANDKKVHSAILAIPSGGLIEGGILMLRVYRDANNGADGHDADARIFDFHIHYTRDKI